jgi:DNA-binding NtrC family response regulator
LGPPIAIRRLAIAEESVLPMPNVLPLYPSIRVLFVEDDWVIRQILLEHFAAENHCRTLSFSDAKRALAHLRQQGGSERIFSNLEVGGHGGIDLSAGTSWPIRIELAIAPGYDAERDRFQAIEAGLGFFRVKPFTFNDLWQLLQQTRSRTNYR